MNTLMLAEPVRFPLSVTEAVIVWVPAERVLTGMEPPVPSGPSRFEFHWIDELRLPCSVSLAVAVKLMDAPLVKVDPFAGALMLTTGGVLADDETVTATLAEAVSPPLSITEAVIVWVPVDRV